MKRFALALLIVVGLLFAFGRPVTWVQAALVMTDVAAGGQPTLWQHVTAAPREYPTRWQDGEGDLYLGTTASFKSKTFQFEIPNPYFDQDGYALFDASIVYTAPNDRWSIGLHGKNLADKQYKTSGYTFMAADPRTGVLLLDAAGRPRPALGKEGVLTAFYGNPIQVYLTGTVQF